MTRGEKAAYNSLSSILSQIVAIISAFILPRLIMSHFGSAYNGITASISQFLSVVALLRGGVGGATRVALYKSLAEGDNHQTSAIIKATEIFMRKIAIVFVGIIVAFACVYPILVKKEFEWFFSASLVLIVSISTFMQYFFGITYQFLLQADQRQYINTLIDIVTVIINVVLSVLLIQAGVGIHGVKLGSAIAFSITPIVLYLYCKKRYKLRTDINPDFSSINQRWDSFFHQVATFIHDNTDLIILTAFTSQRVISVYTTYYLVANGIRKIVQTISVGVEAAFGDMIARNDQSALQINISIYETMIHIISCVLFGAALVLITPFVKVYTQGVTDVNYVRYVFGYLVIIGEMLYCLRSPYEAVINAAGHFKQTKKYVFIEAGINLLLSLILVYKYGLIGVVLGTVISILYRIIMFSMYAARNIIHSNRFICLKRFLISFFTVVVIFFLSKIIPCTKMKSYIDWIRYAIPVGIISVVVTVVLNYCFYKEETCKTINKLYKICGKMIRKLMRNS